MSLMEEAKKNGIRERRKKNGIKGEADEEEDGVDNPRVLGRGELLNVSSSSAEESSLPSSSSSPFS